MVSTHVGTQYFPYKAGLVILPFINLPLNSREEAGQIFERWVCLKQQRHFDCRIASRWANKLDTLEHCFPSEVFFSSEEKFRRSVCLTTQHYHFKNKNGVWLAGVKKCFPLIKIRETYRQTKAYVHFVVRFWNNMTIITKYVEISNTKVQWE